MIMTVSQSVPTPPVRIGPFMSSRVDLPFQVESPCLTPSRPSQRPPWDSRPGPTPEVFTHVGDRPYQPGEKGRNT